MRPEVEGNIFTTDTLQTVGLMHWSDHSHLFLYLLHSTQTISALFFYQTGNLTAEASPTPSLTQALNETLQPDNLDYHCSEAGPSIRNVPRLSDCKYIVDYILPPSSEHHKFYRSVNYGDQDIYRLPYQAYYMTCAIEIDLVAGFTSDITSWLTIGATAIGLTQECLYAGHGLGGWVAIGDNHGIYITVRGTVSGIVEGNETTS